MKQFKDFNIKNEVKGFIGDKINIDRVLNKQIVVNRYSIEDSKKKQNSKCLYLQITVDGEPRVVFLGSVSLMQMIQKVPQENFPFTTTIIKDNWRLEFT